MTDGCSLGTVPLRERQRRALREDIERAALRLFAAQGFDKVTTDAIARAVGISPRTFFRHVPSKDHLLLAATQRGRAQILSTFRSRPDDEDLAISVAASILARTAQFVDDREGVELWRQAMRSAPAGLQRASLLSVQDCEELIGAVTDRLDPSSPSAGLQAGIIVRTSLAAAEHVYEWWLNHDQDESLHELTRQALDQVANGLLDRTGGLAPLRQGGSR